MTAGDDANPPAETKATVRAAIKKLRTAIAQAESQADQVCRQGAYLKATQIDTHVMRLVRQLRRLRQRQDEQIIDAPSWRDVNTHLDALDGHAQDAQAKMGRAERTVATVKALTGVVGKLLAAL